MPKAAPSPQRQLDGFIRRYSPEMQKRAKSTIRKMRARLPGAVELVYDNYNWLVVGYGPNDRASEAVFSLALAPQWVTLCFLRNGPRIPDPKKLLRGNGTRVRHIRLSDAGDLDKPTISNLMGHAERLAGDPFPKRAPRKLVIKSISTKQRSRRPPPAKAKR